MSNYEAERLYNEGKDYVALYTRTNNREALAQALLKFLQVLQHDPEHPEANLFTAVFLLLAASKEPVSKVLSILSDAEEKLKKTIQYLPTNASAHYHLGNIYFRRSEWYQASEELRLAIRYGYEGDDAKKLLKKVQTHLDGKKWWEFWK